MNTGILIDCVFLVGFALFARKAVDSKRTRAPWAKLVFGICAVIGVAKGGVGLAWDLGWFTLGAQASRRLDGYLYMVGGLLLGLIVSLALSGELLGRRHTDEGSREQLA